MARRPPIAALRKLLLVALVLLVAAVVSLFLFGRAGRRPARLPADPDDIRAEEGSTLIGEDFDYTLAEGRQTIFRIRGESIRADRQGTVFLQDVGLTLYDEQGRPFHVESRRASFNRTSNEGRLQGDVVLKGPEDLELRTPQLQIREKGRMLVAPGVSELRYGTLYFARSKKMWVHVEDQVFILAGNVRVENQPPEGSGREGQGGVAAGEPPMSLSAERLVYERQRRHLRVEGGTELRRGGEHVKARKLSVNLAQDERSIEFLRALWDVSGQIAAPEEDARSGGATALRFAGKELALFMQPQQNEVRKVALDGAEQQRARFETIGGEFSRILTARRVEGMLARGVLSSAEAFGMVELRETPRGRPRGGSGPRSAEGQRAQAQFSPSGELASVVLLNNVSYRDDQVQAKGNRAAIDLAGNQGEFLGDPVEVLSERGRLTAPRVLYDTDDEIVHAVGGVRGVMEQVSDTELAGTPLGEGEGPVFVESQEAFWRQSPSSFLFRGDVRAWRGKSLLLAAELRGDKAQDRLTGSGGVKSVWIPADEPGAGGRGRSAQERAPIEVTASELSYRQGAGLLTYTGNVRVLQTGRTLSCRHLEVKLDEGNEAETMTCTGEARLTDPKAGREIAGERALYHVDRRLVEMFGEGGLVTMRDRAGNRVQGKRLIYHIDDGKVEVLGASQGEAAPAAAKAEGGG